MSEFLEILTHGRRLQGAVKDLSVEELNSVQDKLNNIIEKRKEQEASPNSSPTGKRKAPP